MEIWLEGYLSGILTMNKEAAMTRICSIATIGVYFKDNRTFFALYPTESELTMYSNGTEYPLKKELHISLKRWEGGGNFLLRNMGSASNIM